MIKRLRRRFVVAAMAATFVVLFVMIGGMNLLNYYHLIEDADRLTHMVADHDGHFETRKPQNQTDERKQSPQKKSDHKSTDTGAADTETSDTGTSGTETEDTEISDAAASDTGRSGKKAPDRGMDDKKMPAETPYTTRYFSVLVTEDDAQIIDLDHIASVEEAQALAYGQSVEEQGKTHGFYGDYRYRSVQTQDGTMVVFVDCEAELNVFYSTLAVSVLMSLIGYAAVFLLVLLSSGVVLRPVRESYEKQKQFITDASHELKTPLTIIDANVEILEMEHGADEWTGSIHNQIQRLSGLTNQLVTLARMDEENGSIQKEAFDLSEAVYDTMQGFQPVAQTRELALQMQIADALIYRGEESRIRQLIGILMDNAVKYALPGSVIEVRLYKKGRQIIFEVSNAAEGLEVGERQELFGRFYRSDASRSSKTGGSGIGLAVAQAIVTAHKGTIRAFSPDAERLHLMVIL